MRRLAAAYNTKNKRQDFYTTLNICKSIKYTASKHQSNNQIRRGCQAFTKQSNTAGDI
jgi:hypothetical protein